MHRREGAREDAGVTRRILTLWVIYDNPLDYPRPTKKGPDERGRDRRPVKPGGPLSSGPG